MGNMAYQTSIIEKTIKIEGSGVKLAEILGVDRRQISRWKLGKRHIPIKHCVTLSNRYEFVDLEKLIKCRHFS